MSANATNLLITKIEVRNLFGEFDYDVESPHGPGEVLPLTVLYGDNGAGKTTILRLLFNLLSAVHFAGHRTYVGSVEFTRLAVYFANGYTVSADRVNSSEPPYVATIKLGGESVLEWEWRKPSNRDELSSEEQTSYFDFCKLLSEIAPKIHFLSDDRKTHSFAGENKKRKADAGIDSIQRESGDKNQSNVRLAIEAAMQKLSLTAYAGANRAYESANTIYRDIVHRIVSHSGSVAAPPQEARNRLLSRLRELSTLNSSYSQFYLTSDLDVADLESQIMSAGSESLSVIDSVLTPYLDGIQARLDALAEVRRVLAAFSQIMNSFFQHKLIEVRLPAEIKIQSRNGKSLRPEELSSGEQQLLLLVCNAISARGNNSVFVIDEPELSLNVKWQRNLVDALLKIFEGSNHQLILATHSIELLSQYRSQVVPLRNMKTIEGAR
jgi:energy-coupling factor transporter ATP-binding protein EcfA2